MVEITQPPGKTPTGDEIKKTVDVLIKGAKNDAPPEKAIEAALKLASQAHHGEGPAEKDD